MIRRRLSVIVLWVVPLGCGGEHRDESVAESSASASSTGDVDPGDSGSDGVYDVGDGLDLGGNVAPTCDVKGDLDGVGDCDEVAPPDSFDPEVQWGWLPENGEIFSTITPLVANLTDDDQNGSVDLCDIPDIVVVTTSKITNPPDPAHLWIIDGATGVPHIRIERPVKENATPAIADLDDDGVPEIITATFDQGGEPARLLAFAPDGTVKWESPHTYPAPWYGSAVAVGDVDNDGDPELAYHDMLFDHEGNLLWSADTQLIVGDVPAFADLDGDQDLEVLIGSNAYHHDGSLYFQTSLPPGFAAVADMDGDSLPEVIMTGETGIALLEHDGSIVYSNVTPTGVEATGLNWARPVTVHNFDQDPEPEFAMSSRDFYSVYEADATVVWSAPVLDESGFAAGTAFDFLGDAEAEAMYADEYDMFIFDGQGQVLLQTPRASHTLHEYPVVADIDNDGSAEILVVSEEREALFNGMPTIPTLQAIKDKDDRWIQARRIWNQHTYHVTNVREDATIPQFETPHWTQLNTYRTNAQLHSGGGVCKPIPEG